LGSGITITLSNNLFGMLILDRSSWPASE
jgi:hypothetical protein